jgi:parallel beta-helix repeat protein
VDVGGDRNRIVGNVFVGGWRPAIVLQGSSRNVVQGNRACGRRQGPLVALETARWDDGRPAASRRNRLADNEDLPAEKC